MLDYLKSSYRDDSDGSAIPLEYATSGTNSAPPEHHVRNLGICSLFTAFATIAVCTFVLFECSAEIGELRLLIILHIVLGAVLLVGAIAIIRSAHGGVVIHRIYAIAQIIASLVFGIALANAIFDSPGGPVYFIGIVPGLVRCVYPAFVLFVLGLNVQGR